MNVGAGKINLEKRKGMIINREYLPILQDSGLLEFDRISTFKDGRIVKLIKDRSVTRIEIQHATGNYIFYLKRHFEARASLSELITRWLSGRCISPGMAEFKNICDFRNSNIPTAAPVAAGERQTGPFRYESFLITESFEPYISLEKIIRHHPERLKGPKGEIRKKRILEAVAHLAKIMHRGGFNHRDFNATHVLINPEKDAGKFTLALFDLQRVDRKKWMRFRWAIKTLAELYYSMPEHLFSDDDRLILFKKYKEKSEMTLWDHLILFWIKRKTRRIGRHTRKIMERRQMANLEPIRKERNHADVRR